MKDARALLLVGLYTGAWLVLGIGVTALVGLAIASVLLSMQGTDLSDAAEIMKLASSPPVLVGTLLVQFPVMYGLAETVRWLGERELLRIPRQAWSEVYAWRPVSLPVLGIGCLLGLTTGWLPGWVATQLREALPWLDFGTFDTISGLLRESHPVLRVLGALCIVGVAPVVEELVFRGFLWDAMDKAAGPWAALIVVSPLFAVYHMDPIQGTALLFTAFVLGWVRLATGSLLPCIALHTVNNLLGVLGSVLPAADEVQATPLPAVLVATAVTLSLCAAISRYADPSLRGDADPSLRGHADPSRRGQTRA